MEQDNTVEYDDNASESSEDIDSDEWVQESDLDDPDDDELSSSADEVRTRVRVMGGGGRYAEGMGGPEVS